MFVITVIDCVSLSDGLDGVVFCCSSFVVFFDLKLLLKLRNLIMNFCT